MKSIVIFFFSFFAVLVHAEVKWVSVGGEYGTSENLDTKKAATSMGVQAFIGLQNNWVLEVRNRTQQTDSAGSTNYAAPMSWQEVGATKSFDVGFFDVYGRGLIGFHEFTAKRYSFHAEELGIAVKFSGTPFGYSLGRRFIDSFSDSDANAAKNEQTRLTLNYDIDKSHRVHVRFTDQSGGTNSKMVNFGYSYRF